MKTSKRLSRAEVVEYINIYKDWGDVNKIVKEYKEEDYKEKVKTFKIVFRNNQIFKGHIVFNDASGEYEIHQVEEVIWHLWKDIA